MSIKELTRKTLGKNKVGWTWDRKRELFFTWQIDVRHLGKRKVERGFKSEKEAEAYLEQLKTQARLKELGFAKPMKFPTVAKLLEKHLTTFHNKHEYARASRVIKTFLKMLSAQVTIDEIERKHTKDYSDLRLSQNVKPETVFREITVISSALHKAADYFEGLEKWIPPKIYRPQISDEGRERIVTRDERDGLVNYLLREQQKGESHRDFIARRRAGLTIFIALLTGLRHGEICALKKADFDLKTKRLRAERFKTKKKGVAVTVFQPLTTTQIWILNEAAKLYPDGEFFFSERGKIHNKIYSLLKEVCKKLDIPYGRNTKGGIVFHDSRHTFVTNLLQSGVDMTTAKNLSGHSTNSMLMRYSHSTYESNKLALQIASDEISNDTGRQILREIFDETVSGELTFESFYKRIAKCYNKTALESNGIPASA